MVQRYAGFFFSPTVKCGSIAYLPLSGKQILQNSCQEDFKPDQDQDDAAEDRRLSGQFRADFPPQQDAGHADGEGHRADDQRFRQRQGKAVSGV